MRSTSTSRRKVATPGRARPALRGDGAHTSGRNACAPAGFPVIAMAASAGGLKALSVILGGLPADFPAAIAIVMHLAPDHNSILAEILSRRTHLVVNQAHTGDVLCPACVFVAPPNQHLFVAGDGRLKLSSSAAEKVHFARPSAEPLFASVAEVYKQNAIAVVLTGGDGDGSFGVQIIKDEGGQVIAQDRPTSEDFSMPETSIKTGDVDFILPLDEIAPKLIELVGRTLECGDLSPLSEGDLSPSQGRRRALAREQALDAPGRATSHPAKKRRQVGALQDATRHIHAVVPAHHHAFRRRVDEHFRLRHRAIEARLRRADRRRHRQSRQRRCLHGHQRSGAVEEQRSRRDVRARR